MRGILSEQKTYRFRLTDNATSGLALSTTAGGVFAGAFNCDPSGGTGGWTSDEWSALTALFSEVRVIKFTVHFMIAAPPVDSKIDGTLPGNTFTVSSVLSNIGATPTSSAQVFDNADAKVYSLYHTQRTPIQHTLKQRNRLNFAIVTAPAPGSYAGCYGGIQWYGDNVAASVTLGYAKIEGIYEFRSRI